MMKSYVELKKDVSKLAAKKKVAACIELVGIFNEIMAEHKIKPIVAGGLAVEIYTRCGYYIDDIDIMVKNSGLLRSVLDKLGFEMVGNHWHCAEIGVGLEIFNMDPQISLETISHIKLSSGREIYVMGIEDLILDRLKNYYQYNSNYDYEWAYRIYKIHRGVLDIDYLLEKALSLNGGAVSMISKW